MTQSFRFLEKEKILDPYSVQLLRRIRAFGNLAIHRPDSLIGRKVVKGPDVVFLLICLSEVSILVRDFLKTNEGK